MKTAGGNKVEYMEYILIFIGILVVVVVLENMVRKIFKIEKQKFIYDHVNSLHHWSDILLGITWVAATIVMTVTESVERPVIYVFIFLMILNVSRAFWEWKYRKPEKQYIIALMNSIIFLILFYGFTVYPL